MTTKKNIAKLMILGGLGLLFIACGIVWACSEGLALKPLFLAAFSGYTIQTLAVRWGL